MEFDWDDGNINHIARHSIEPWILRKEFPHLRKMPSMWTTSYFASTAGKVSAATIERYIQAQSIRA